MTLAGRARLVGAASRIAAHRAAELVVPGRPGPVPRSTSELTTGWLTAALCGGHPGAAVLDFELGAGSDGTSARRPLRVGYNDAGRAAGLPEALYTKSAPDLMTRLFCGLNDLMVAETEFYLRIRPELDIETPVAQHGVYERSSGRSLLVMEDIAATRGATFGDPRHTRVDRANADRMVELMAAYHGALWEDPRLDREFGWLRRSEDFQRRLGDMMGFRRMFDNGVRRSRELLPPELVARQDDLWPALMASLELRAAQPRTLLHQDVHARNWYFTGDGRIGLYDWQGCAQGYWAVDVGYALSCGLEVADRRAWERDLLARYLDRLAAAGGKAPSFEQAWLGYRGQLIHGLAYWLATIGVTRLQPQLQPVEVCALHIGRMAQAVADLDTLDALLSRTSVDPV